MGWVSAVKALSWWVVAPLLGLVEQGRRWGPCPACGELSSAGERRGCLLVKADEIPCWWRCVRGACGAGGSLVDLLGHHLDADPVAPVVRAWFEAHSLIPSHTGGGGGHRPGAPVAAPVEGPGPPSLATRWRRLPPVDPGWPDAVHGHLRQHGERPDGLPRVMVRTWGAAGDLAGVVELPHRARRSFPPTGALADTLALWWLRGGGGVVDLFVCPPWRWLPVAVDVAELIYHGRPLLAGVLAPADPRLLAGRCAGMTVGLVGLPSWVGTVLDADAVYHVAGDSLGRL